MLMDEPLSNLDAKLRNQMRAELLKLRERIDTTFIYVTHDQVEAMTLGDRIVIMKDGFIQQVGTPQEVFNHPYNLFVAGFIGSPQMNIFDDAKLKKVDGKYAVELGGHTVVLSDEKQEKLLKNNVSEQAVKLGLRPEHITMATDGNGVEGVISVHEMMGSSIHLHITVGDKDIIVIVDISNMTFAQVQELHAGVTVKLTFGGNNCHVFGTETGINLEA
jgi:multiple sugar transport system ATP-binding protein